MTTPAVSETIKDSEAPPIELDPTIALELAEILEKDERTATEVEAKAGPGATGYLVPESAITPTGSGRRRWTDSQSAGQAPGSASGRMS